MPRTNISTEEKALKVYQSQLKAMRKYAEKHKDKFKEINKQRYENLKANPEKYKEFLEKKKAYYQKKKAEKENQTETI